MFHRDSKGHVAALVGSHMTKIMILMMMIILKGPSQPLPFSMQSKLLILHGEAKSEFFTIVCS